MNEQRLLLFDILAVLREGYWEIQRLSTIRWLVGCHAGDVRL